jgi:hypothetical protein
MNAIGLDPSYGVGDNVGTVIDNNANAARLGATFQPSNFFGSSAQASVVKSSRLGVGYRGDTDAKGDMNSGNFEALSVINDGTTTAIRVSTEGILTGAWKINGLACMVTLSGSTRPAAQAYITTVLRPRPSPPCSRCPKGPIT